MTELKKPDVKDLIVKTECLLDKSNDFMNIAVRGFDGDSLMKFRTFDDKKLANIASKMPEINRATNAFGRKNSQTMGKMMTLNMISYSSFSRMKQCLAQIENKRTALKENIFRLQKDKILLEKLVWKRDRLLNQEVQLTDPEEIAELEFKVDLLNVDIAKKAANISDSTLYLEGCLKEIGMYQNAYEEIRRNNNIPEKWDEGDFERGEIEHHIKTAFIHLIRDIMMTGRINVGTSEYLEQFGINPIIAIKHVNEYLQSLTDASTIKDMYSFINKMYDKFKDAHKDVLEEMGVENLINEEFLYLEDKE